MRVVSDAVVGGARRRRGGLPLQCAAAAASHLLVGLRAADVRAAVREEGLGEGTSPIAEARTTILGKTAKTIVMKNGGMRRQC